MSRIRFWAAWWVVCFALWVLLTYNPVAQEFVAGAFAAAIAATAVSLVREQRIMSFGPRLKWLARAGRVPVEMIRDTVTVSGALYRKVVRREDVVGAWRAIPFSEGGDDARSAARRALFIAAISATPNALVAGIDAEENLMLVHQLVPSPPDRVEEEVTGWL
jgi:multisubunit Na+/H+ antiporter MnhE subunit